MDSKLFEEILKLHLHTRLLLYDKNKNLIADCVFDDIIKNENDEYFGHELDIDMQQWKMFHVDASKVELILFDISDEERNVLRKDEWNKRHNVYGKHIINSNQELDDLFHSFDSIRGLDIPEISIERDPKKTVEIFDEAMDNADLPEDDKELMKLLFRLIDSLDSTDADNKA